MALVKELSAYLQTSNPQGNTMLQTDAESRKKHGTPGVFAWFIQAVSAVLLATGVYAAFILPLGAVAWGVVSYRRADRQDHKTWISYVLIAAVIASLMVIMLLWMSPSGSTVQTPTISTPWEPTG